MAAGLPVIVSSACGCEVDLVEEGVTGWRFEANAPQQLVDCLRRTDQQSAEARELMIKAARLRLADFSLDAFAIGLRQACEHALACHAPSLRSQLLARLLQQGR